MTYFEWEAQRGLTPDCHEASYAEAAWNAAIAEARSVVNNASKAEGANATKGQVMTFILTELEFLES